MIETTQNGELIRKYQHEIEKQKRYIERLKKGQDKKIAEMKIENRQYRKNLSEQKKQTEAKKALCNCLFLGYTVLERFDRIFYSGLTCDPENLRITIMRKTDNDIRRIK